VTIAVRVSVTTCSFDGAPKRLLSDSSRTLSHEVRVCEITTEIAAHEDEGFLMFVYS
jgi:hypothetical protein